MATTVPLTGAGATISGLGYTSYLTSIKVGTTSIAALEISTLDSTGYKKMRPSDLRETPEVTVGFFYVGGAPPTGTTGTNLMSVNPGTLYAGSTFTVTFPLLTGTATTTGGSVTGTAFVKSVDMPECKLGEIMTGTMTMQFDGATGPTWL